MAIIDALLPEFDHEMGTTRRLLERVPDGELTWKPHEKSMSLGRLTWHLADLPHWCRTIISTDKTDIAEAPPESRTRAAESRDEVLRAFDKNVAAAREAIAGRTDGELLAPWTLLRGGHAIFTLPRIAALRSFLMNHSIHHRGQLSVYLRLKNVPLPSIYGPTADEGT